MKIIQRKIKTVIKDPSSILVVGLQIISPILSDKYYLKMLFPLRTGYKLDLDNPQTYNAKLQWLKLNYRRDEMTKMVDKYEAKEFAREIIGDEYIIENYGIWNSFNEIDFNILPNQFVLKTTHDQGGVILVRDKSVLDQKMAQRKLEKHLKRKHYYLGREWPYKNVKPRILAEKFLSYDNKTRPNDYKLYCFNGEPKVLLIATDRETLKPKFNYFDLDFKPIDLQQGGERNSEIFLKPSCFFKMINLAKLLSKGLPHVRVDFYCIGESVYFGEMTFFDSGGMAKFYPEKWDKIWGSWIDLGNVIDKKNNLNNKYNV